MIALALALSLAASSEGRLVGAHLFVPPVSLETAYVEPRVTLSTGAVVLELPDLEDGRDLELAGLREQLDAEVGLVRGFGAFGRITADALTATSAESALFRGVAVTGTWRVGLGLEALRAGSTVLGVRGAAEGSFGRQIRPANLLEAVRDAPLGTAQDLLDRDLARLLVVDRSTLGGVGSVLLAQGFGPWLGLQVRGELEGRSRTVTLETRAGEVERQTDELVLGGGAAVDLTPPDVPVVFLAEVNHQRLLEDVAEAFTTGILGVYHRDGESLEIGVALGGQLGGTDDDRLAFGQLTMRYFY